MISLVSPLALQMGSKVKPLICLGNLCSGGPCRGRTRGRAATETLKHPFIAEDALKRNHADHVEILYIMDCIRHIVAPIHELALKTRLRPFSGWESAPSEALAIGNKYTVIAMTVVSRAVGPPLLVIKGFSLPRILADRVNCRCTEVQSQELVVFTVVRITRKGLMRETSDDSECLRIALESADVTLSFAYDTSLIFPTGTLEGILDCLSDEVIHYFAKS